MREVTVTLSYSEFLFVRRVFDDFNGCLVGAGPAYGTAYVEFNEKVTVPECLEISSIHRKLAALPQPPAKGVTFG